MTHYQKLATIIFRVIAVMVLIVGLLYLISGFLMGLFWNGPIKVLIFSLPYFIGGIALFALSKLLAKLVCLGLDKTDEK